MNHADLNRWAAFYRRQGFNPLPMRGDAKRPLVRFRQWWERPAPADLFQCYPSAGGIQIMTGRHWRLLVIDCDGEEAVERFQSLGPIPATWTSHSGSANRHYWFLLPHGYRRELRKAELWRADPGKPRVKGEAAIERLCDRSLVVAPPSVHPRTGRTYEFLDPECSPPRLGLPAPCPAWILCLPPMTVTRPECIPPSIDACSPRRATEGPRYRARDVLAAIPDKLALVKSWGLRMASSDTVGWLDCQAIGRADRNPSARFNPELGFYVDFGSGERLRFFDLATALGAYATWEDARDDLGHRYNVNAITTRSAS